MRDRVDELVGEVVDLVRDERDELEALDEARHLVLAVHLDLQLLLEDRVEAVRAAARRDDLDPAAHVPERDPVDLGGALDERADERDAVPDVLRLEPLEVERAPGEVLHGRAPQERVVQVARVQRLRGERGCCGAV